MQIRGSWLAGETGGSGKGDRGGEGRFCDLSSVYVTSFSATVTALILGEGVLGPYLACCIEHVTNLLISASDQASLIGSALFEPVFWVLVKLYYALSLNNS